jgi:hypothetical protein
MNFREFLKLSEQGQAPNKPANLSTTSSMKPSDFGGGGPSKNSPNGPTSKPPGSGNYDAPVQPRQPGLMGSGKGMWPVPPSPMGSGGPTPETPKVPPPPVPQQMTKKMMKKKMKKR